MMNSDGSYRLVDSFGRPITRFRISIIEDCNMNCMYCHREGYRGRHGSKLTLKQIRSIAEIAVKYGVKGIKLTGGEPLIHPEIVEIVRTIREIAPDIDLSMTTNGTLLEHLAFPLKEAGLNRVNIGCDSLVNNPSIKSLLTIEKSVQKAKEAGFDPIKINMVILKGINEHEIPEMIEFCAKNGFILQILELIDTNREFYRRYHVDLSEIERELGMKAVKITRRQLHARNQYHLPGGAVVEVVHPMHNSEFCANCKVMRITHDYQFQPCLNRTDNLVPIGDDIEKALMLAMERRVPFYRTPSVKKVFSSVPPLKEPSKEGESSSTE